MPSKENWGYFKNKDLSFDGVPETGLDFVTVIKSVKCADLTLPTSFHLTNAVSPTMLIAGRDLAYHRKGINL